MTKEDDAMNEALEQLSIHIRQGKRVKGLDLRKVNLGESDLSKLTADQLDLSFANLQGAKFLEARLSNCNFTRGIFIDTNWENATVRMCLFDGIQGSHASFKRARIEDSSVKSANLNGTSFIGTKLTETTFERSAMQECIFHHAEGDGVIFRGADLSSASFKEAQFNDADFRGADLRGANLSKGCFRNADFRGALLEGALFEGTDCNGAIFDADAGPFAASPEKEKSRRNDEFADTMVTLLGNNLTELPGVFADKKEFLQDLTDRLKQAGETFKATSKHSPEEWKEWAESFLALAKDKENVDLEKIIGALYEGPINLQNQSLLGAVSKDEMLDRMRALSKLLNSAAQEPPDEWKPMLEPLMKKTKAGEAIDFKTVFELLSNWSRVLPPQ